MRGRPAPSPALFHLPASRRASRGFPLALSGGVAGIGKRLAVLAAAAVPFLSSCETPFVPLPATEPEEEAADGEEDEWGFEERWPYTDGVYGKVRRGASWEGGVF